MRERAKVDWYQEGGIYGPDYLALFADEIAAGTGEAERAVRLLGLTPGQLILDVACGYGRHSIPLARQAVRVVGLDLNGYFLSLAKEHASAEHQSAQFVCGDMRQLPFKGVFDAAVCMGGSMGQFSTEEEDLALLQQAAEALKPGGKFLLDVANRDGMLSHFIGKDWDEREDGTVVLHERQWDALSGRMERKDTVIGPDGRKREYERSMRLYGAPEITSLVRRAGFDVLALYGGLAGSALGWDSPRVNVVARRIG